jgi:FKBP-type peptidyl-prolyl cis-trans isomerase
MKTIHLAVCAAIVWGSSAQAAEAPKTESEKLSYAIGADIGQGLKRSGFTDKIDVGMLTGALSESFVGKDLAMTAEEMQAAITKLRGDMQQKMESESKAAGEENQKKGDAYLAENAKKEGVKATESGIQYKVLKEGKGKKPTAESTVSTHYAGRLINGTEFDSSIKRGEPASFPLKGVIPGWTEILQLMPVGSKWEVTIPAKLAYGENAPPAIGPNQTLIFEIELLEIQEGDKAEDKAGATPGEKKK